MEAHEANESYLKSTASVRSTEILEPEFLRPADAFDRYRIKRGHLYRLMESGRVRSVSLRERGKLRGLRLVVHSSLRDYVFSHEEVSGYAPEAKAASELAADEIPTK
jgi:hypothetical protein